MMIPNIGEGSESAGRESVIRKFVIMWNHEHE